MFTSLDCFCRWKGKVQFKKNFFFSKGCIVKSKLYQNKIIFVYNLHCTVCLFKKNDYEKGK